MSTDRTEEFDLRQLLPGRYYCADCGARVCAGVLDIDGVRASDCDEDSGVLVVTYSPHVVSVGRLREAVQRRAMEEAGTVGHAVYRLTGLD